MPTRVMNSGGVEGGGYFMEKRVGFKDAEKNEVKGFVKNSKSFHNNVSNFSCELSSSSSSSIGENSDVVSEKSMEKTGDGEEVQSSCDKGALDAMEALEEVLPIRRGISSFYNGKSKSFASLAEASSSSSSIKDIAKPDNAYSRKRRNLLSCSLHWDKNRTSCLKTINSGGISKRPTGSTRTTLALGVAMSNNNCESDRKKDNNIGEGVSTGSPLLATSPWRSFSLADLQHCVSVAKTCTNTNSDR